MTDGMFGLLYDDPDGGFGTFRCGKLPDTLFTMEEIPQIFVEELARVTGIKMPVEETEISWDVQVDKQYGDYDTPAEYFRDGGFLGLRYSPKTRMPGERWRCDPLWMSHEISAACQRIKMFKEGYLTVEERLTRWALVFYIATRINEFQSLYSDRPEDWNRVLLVLDIREEDIGVTIDFASGMHLLNPIYDLIPIKVLEVITVFRVMFRLSLQEFESAYHASEHRL